MLFLLMLVFSLKLTAQTLVSTEPTLKTVVLENFTGINCPNCPDGHSIAESIRAANPDRVIIVGVHQGSYAAPTSGQPDFRTSFGNSLATQAKLTGYPAGCVNRHVFTAYAMNNGTAMSRGAWSAAASQILAQTAPVNVGVKSVFNPSTRLLTVNVEAFYTSAQSITTNNINVALLESNVIAYQAGGSANYNHKNILRHFLTGQWGDTITNLTYGSFRQKTYTYVVPAGYNIDNCDVAVYIAQGQQEILNGKRIPANGGHSTQIASFNKPDYIEDASPSILTNVPVLITSNLAGTETFNISLTTDAPGDWNASYTVNSNTYTSNGSGNFTFNTPENISIDIIPGTTPAIACYTLTISSVSQPLLPAITKRIYIISDVTDLIVNNNGSWGDGGSTTPANFQSNFIKGLQHAGETKFAFVPLSTFLRIGNADKLNGIIGVYYNVGWSFPSLTNESVSVFKKYLDNGGNMMISGQDIGWDNFDVANGGNGSSTTQSFYTNYLKSSFVNDGTTANNQITINNTDLVFGNVNNSSIINAYGSGSSGAFMYPDQINPTSSGVAFFYYNGNTQKTGGVRSNGGVYKTVNMGISVEMIGDTNIRKEFVSTTYQWFHGIITDLEYDKKIYEITANCYPNPAKDFVYIPLDVSNKNIICELYDLNGRIIKHFNIHSNTTIFKMDIEDVRQGNYFYRLYDGNMLNISKPLQIIK